jgi:superfamily II DNA helicase RecQ
MSIIPKHVNIMALTATATTKLQNDIIKTLGMINLEIVENSPDKSNLFW